MSPSNHTGRRFICALILLGLALWPSVALADGTTFALFPYWADGKPLTWYNFGSRSLVKDGHIQAQRQWVLTTGTNASGQPIEVPGQLDIFEANPGTPAYSDLSQVILVQAPAGYTANTFKSRADIEAAGLKQTATNDFWNTPFVNRGDSLGGVSTSAMQGWVDGQAVWYFELGPTSPVPGQMWRFATGFDAQGKPITVSGQYTVSDLSPSAFRDVFVVLVPPGYAANSITTVAQVQASGYPIQDTKSAVNVPLPVVTSPPTDTRSPGAYGIILVLVLGWLAGSAYLLKLPSPRRRTATAQVVTSQVP